MKHLLVDFGASRVKAVIYDSGLNQVIDTFEQVSPSQKNHNCQPAYTVPISLYRQCLECAATTLLHRHRDTQRMYICSEMHGFCMDDDYVSWKDSRADVTAMDQTLFYQRTGMLLRSGLAYATLKTLNPSGKHIGTLISAVLDQVIGNDITLTASQGFVDKHTQEISQAIMSEFDNVSMVPLAKNHIGYFQHLPVYGGLGDLQAALLGADLGHTADMVLNLGTGSQVAVITQDLTTGDLRPYVNNTWIRVISHIPAGRALNAVAEIFVPKRFWRLWQDLSAEQVLAADSQQVDLNLFASAWQYTNNSGFIRLKENQSADQQVAAVARSWVQQYIHAMSVMGRQHRVRVSGGLAHKTPWLLTCLSALDNQRTFFISPSVTGEETLDGLARLAQQ